MSLIKAIKAQLGLSVTPANNFTLDASADDGTMKLARGNAGATTQDIMTVDAAGKVAFPQNVASRSVVRCEQQNNHGSTSTCIRRFLTNPENVGTDITYTDSATLGASFTINTSGFYSISYTDNFSIASNLGISINTNQGANNISGISLVNILAAVTTAAASYMGCVAWSGYLAAGSIIRAHSGGAGASTSPVVFTISRIG